ncbi:type VII secretion system-associated protein [Saccharopolyspora oryzae]|uniref:Type VII secretion system-associated protein n=1 Tax=Saccharopolyspora oryzae TaxID=2997343 RepID=A0ABT4V758_9PSEU|nr:type VII secretion system-associated protein [Saccharopolyspora oryzae]MDA3629214.1 type VII secretion system-associated protein [Saccharopolyspora oryzae]
MSEPNQPDLGQLVPPITDEMREHAKENPNSWLYITDPGYASEGGDVPPEGIVGAYRIDPDGEIDPEFQLNDRYEPSELVTQRPEPTNELERVLVEIAEGRMADAALPAAVLDAELLLYAPDEEDSMLYTAEMSDGSQLVPACTSLARVPSDWPGVRKVPGSVLPELLGGLALGLNLHEAVQAIIPNSVLTEVAAERS